MNRQAHDRRSIVTAVAVIAIVSAVVWHGLRPTPLPPAQGIILNRPDGIMLATTPVTLRLATFNIHSGIGMDGVKDLKRIASVLRNSDVVGLNEVRGFPGTLNDAKTLGDELHMPWLFAPTEQRWWHDDFGNGVLCRLPIRSWRRTPLPATRNYGFRNVVQLAVEWYGRTLSVLITHVDNYRDRVTQLRILGEMFASTSPPALLMGDLNTTATDPPLRRILSSPGIVDAVGLKLRGASPERIDWIITRGLETVNAGMTNREASDHSMVWAEVRVP